MTETLLVLGAVALLVALAFGLPVVPAGWVVAAGVACTAVGLLLGVPTGLAYHWNLRACLAPRGELPERWWLRPVALHRHLRPDERAAVLRWFTAGGAGFVLTLVGCAAIAAGVVLEAFRAGLL